MIVNELPVNRLVVDDNEKLPLVITPAENGTELADYVNSNRSEMEKLLTRHGGILFRGFGMDTVEKFNHFMSCFDTKPLPYMFRSSPRNELDQSFKNIYTSTIYPNLRSINMHNESSYSRVWGKKIIFCCLVPAAEGGETPIADCRMVLAKIDSNLREKFRTKGVKYRRNISSAFGMPWQEVFQTNDREQVKAICRKYDIKWQFLGDDQLVIEWIKPAIYEHQLSGEETWFNHVLFFNKYSRYEELGLSHEDKIPQEFLSSDTFFGDGSEINFDEYSDIKRAYQVSRKVFPYEKGDVLFLDNMLVAHGRNPYKGDRTIGTAIIEPAFDRGYEQK